MAMGMIAVIGKLDAGVEERMHCSIRCCSYAACGGDNHWHVWVVLGVIEDPVEAEVRLDIVSSRRNYPLDSQSTRPVGPGLGEIMSDHSLQ